MEIRRLRAFAAYQQQALALLGREVLDLLHRPRSCGGLTWSWVRRLDGYGETMATRESPGPGVQKLARTE
jgi:hypothetical protein